MTRCHSFLTKHTSPLPYGARARWAAASVSTGQIGWLLITGALILLAIGLLALPQSPMMRWLDQAIPPTTLTLPPGTVVTPAGAVAAGSCQPYHAYGTQYTVTMVFPEPEPLNRIGFGECGDPWTETVTVKAQTPVDSQWTVLTTFSVPPDGYTTQAYPVGSYTALEVIITQPIPDAQDTALGVGYAPLLP